MSAEHVLKSVTKVFVASSFSTEMSVTILHNGTSYQASPACLREFSSRAASLLAAGKQLVFRDKVSEKVFACFLDLCHNREVSIVPGDMPQLVELVREWDAEKAVLELENRIIESQNPAAIISFYRSSPAVFRRLGTIIADNFVSFSRYPEMVDVPLEHLNKLLHGDTAPVAAAIRERFRQIKQRIRPDVKRQQEQLEEAMRKDVAELRAQIESARAKVREIEARVSRSNDVKALDEKVEEKLDEIEDIMVKMKAEVVDLNGMARATAQIEERVVQYNDQTKELVGEIERMKTHI